jgi:hypothetical protein
VSFRLISAGRCPQTDSDADRCWDLKWVDYSVAPPPWNASYRQTGEAAGWGFWTQMEITVVTKWDPSWGPQPGDFTGGTWHHVETNGSSCTAATTTTDTGGTSLPTFSGGPTLGTAWLADHLINETPSTTIGSDSWSYHFTSHGVAFQPLYSGAYLCMVDVTITFSGRLSWTQTLADIVTCPGSPTITYASLGASRVGVIGDALYSGDATGRRVKMMLIGVPGRTVNIRNYDKDGGLISCVSQTSTCDIMQLLPDTTVDFVSGYFTDGLYLHVSIDTYPC